MPDWYRALFSPSVQSGVLPAHALAGFRNRAVLIRGSEHVPPPNESVTELLETLFALLADEPHPGVRAVLGHFFFVYIHPYPDGNGRIGRFFMNAMLATGGYPWTVVRVVNRGPYLAALEEASVRHDIVPFTRFIAAEMSASEAFKVA
jgi:Fic family protein